MATQAGAVSSAEDRRGGSGVRLGAEARRRQLVGIGLRLLVTRPIHDLPLDVVAAEAGISRGLLFHYFPTKRDYYAAVIEAAAGRLLRAMEKAQARLDPDAGPRDQITALIDGFAVFVQHRRAPYVALVRGAAGADEIVNAIHEQTRDALTDRALTLLPAPATSEAEPDAESVAMRRLAVRGWLALVEDALLDWSAAPFVPRETVVRFLVDALMALLAVSATAQPVDHRVEQLTRFVQGTAAGL